MGVTLDLFAPRPTTAREPGARLVLASYDPAAPAWAADGTPTRWAVGPDGRTLIGASPCAPYHGASARLEGAHLCLEGAGRWRVEVRP